MSGSKKKTGRKEDVKVLERTKRPRRYKVILHNDNYTPRGFVVQLLEQVFRLSRSAAAGVMLHVHNNGRGVIGTYPHGIAETRSAQANKLAREFGFPLMTSTEPE